MTTLLTAPPASKGAGPPQKVFHRSKGRQRVAHKTLLYGTGGIGKTDLTARISGVLFIDLERGSVDIDVERVDGIETWADLRSFLASADLSNANTLAIDSGTKAEELCVQHVIANVKHEKGHYVDSIEGYGFGKGYVHVFTEWRKFLSDLEAIYRRGINIVMICHEQVSLVPNPAGDDFKRYQPRLQCGDKSNSLAATKEWSDHVLFICYDVAVKDGKAMGGGSRSIYTSETATHMAKSRTLPAEPIIFNKGDTTVWKLMTAKPVPAAPEL